VHYCSSAVAVVQIEEIGSWSTEFIIEAFEILGPRVALLAVQSVAQDGAQVIVMMNQHGT
jgi:hypothetical protein